MRPGGSRRDTATGTAGRSSARSTSSGGREEEEEQEEEEEEEDSGWEAGRGERRMEEVRQKNKIQ